MTHGDKLTRGFLGHRLLPCTGSLSMPVSVICPETAGRREISFLTQPSYFCSSVTENIHPTTPSSLKVLLLPRESCTTKDCSWWTLVELQCFSSFNGSYPAFHCYGGFNLVSFQLCVTICFQLFLSHLIFFFI